MSEYKTEQKDYTVSDYSPSWIKKFEEVKMLIEDIFSKKALRIEHVGSTSIVGMKSKPIIDVLVIVDDIHNLKSERKEMEELGYLYKENYLTNDSLFLCKEIKGKRVENIHVFPVGHQRILEFLDKRDYLRVHDEEKERYGDLKMKLAYKFPNDYISYRKEKDHYLNVELAHKVKMWKMGKDGTIL